MNQCLSHMLTKATMAAIAHAVMEKATQAAVA